MKQLEKLSQPVSKMKIRFIPLIIAVIFGCSESDKVEPSTGTCYLTKFVKSPASYDVFEWDVEGRVSKRRYYENNKLYHTVNIIYGGSSTTLTYNYENGTEPNTVRYDYNSKGQLIKEVSSWGGHFEILYSLHTLMTVVISKESITKALMLQSHKHSSGLMVTLLRHHPMTAILNLNMTTK